MSEGFMSQMEKVKVPDGVTNGWHRFQNSWFSNVDFLLYLFVAILFFSIGKSFAQLQSKMTERAYKNNVGGFNQKYKIKKEEPDEERLTKEDKDDTTYIIS